MLRRYLSWRDVCELIWAVKTAGHVVNLMYFWLKCNIRWHRSLQIDARELNALFLKELRFSRKTGRCSVVLKIILWRCVAKRKFELPSVVPQHAARSECRSAEQSCLLSPVLTGSFCFEVQWCWWLFKRNWLFPTLNFGEMLKAAAKGSQTIWSSSFLNH